jgi:hypothetical protein
MASREVGLLVAALSVLCACVASDDAGAPEAATQVAEAVVAAESDSGTRLGTRLAGMNSCVAVGQSVSYSHLTDDSLSGDVDGFRVAFTRVDSTRWVGDGSVSAGDLGLPVPVVAQAASEADSALRFALVEYADTVWFRVRVSCDEFTGTMWRRADTLTVRAAGTVYWKPGARTG